MQVACYVLINPLKEVCNAGSSFELVIIDRSFFLHTVCDLLIPWQEPFVNIPEEKIRNALRVVLGIIIHI